MEHRRGAGPCFGRGPERARVPGRRKYCPFGPGILLNRVYLRLVRGVLDQRCSLLAGNARDRRDRGNVEVKVPLKEPLLYRHDADINIYGSFERLRKEINLYHTYPLRSGNLKIFGENPEDARHDTF